MPRFSVKKPLTVFVAVVAILVLGVVAYTRMTPDLLPNMNFPYVMVVTAYPGASPEKVEAEITKPMEQAMSTLDHIQAVTSTSSENASMVLLEFAESVNMDTIGVDIQQQITTLSAGWDDMVSAPYVLKINPSMLPVEVAALSMDGMDTIALTEFVNTTLLNKLEGIPGVARITSSGMVEQELHVILDQDKIDAVNQRLADAVNGKLDDAVKDLEEQQEELEDAKSKISGAEGQLSQGADAMAQGAQQIQSKKTQMENMKNELQTQLMAAKAGKAAMDAAYQELKPLDDRVKAAEAAQQSAQARVDTLNGLVQQKQELDQLSQRIAELEAAQGGADPQPDPAVPTPPSGETPNPSDQASETPDQPPAANDQTPAAPDQPPAANDQTPAAPDQPLAANDQTPAAPDQPLAADDQTTAAPDQPPASPVTPDQSTVPSDGPNQTAESPQLPDSGQTTEDPGASAVSEGDNLQLSAVAFAGAKKRTATIDLGYGIQAVAYTEANVPSIHLLSSPEEAAELEALKTQYQQKEQIYQAGLAAAGVTDSTLGTELITANAQLASANAEINEIDGMLESLHTSRKELSDTVANMESQSVELDHQIEQMNAALEQLDAGLITIEQASAMLEQQKISGMLQMSAAAGKLAASAATIEAGLSQIESGLQSIEDSRADALRQADLNNILTMDMVTQILNAQNFAMPAGYVAQDGVNYMVSVGDKITDLKTLENLLLFDMGMDGVEPVYLKDVAVVLLTDNSAETYAKLNGRDGVMLSFEKQSTYATAETTNNIQAKFRQLEREYPGLQFVSLMNQGDYIYLIVDSILNSLLLGAVFAILVLWLFLKDLRPTFITLCSIPISVIFAIVLMYFSGVTINMISLSGLAVAVGMLVDNSVVVIENIYRLRAKGANVIQAAVSGAAQVAGAVTASTLTTVCVFLPIVFVDGVTRQLFTDLALTLSYALLASLVVSLTLVPAMASGLLRKEKPQKEGFLEARVMPLYERAVDWALGHRAVVLIAAAAALVLTAAAALAKGFIFMPAMDSPNISVSITMPEEADMQTASGLADQVLDQIQLMDGVSTVGAMMGSSGGSLLGGGGAGHDVTVYVTLSDDSASGAALAREIEQQCADMPCTVTASASMMDMSMLTGSGVSIDVYAEDMDDLQSAARSIAEALGQIEGIGQVSDGLEDAADAFHVAIDRNAAMRHGLTVAQVYMELSQGLKNTGTVATLELDGVTTEVIVEKPKGAVLDLDSLRNYVFEVTNKDGETEDVPLKSFAIVQDTTSLTSIKRSSQRRTLTVTGQVESGYNVTLLTRQAQKAVGSIPLSPGVSYGFSGENETIMDAVEQLLLMLVLGILLVYLVMVAQFQSLKSPFIVMFTIPLAFTGGFLGLLLCGMEVSVISLIGFVMLTGIIVNNGIVLVDYINQLRLEGTPRRDAIVEAGITRMRPILMTTITTVLGLIDIAVRQSAGTALMQPIAVVCIGGLIYATLMTLFVVPCIYDLLNRKELRKVDQKDLELVDL